MADATVTRTLPDTLRVEIHERVPLALAEVDRLYLMDADGGLIDIYGPRTAGFDLPIVRGLQGVDEEARRERARARRRAAAPTSPSWRGEVSEVYVEDSGDLRVVLRGAGEVLRLGAPPYRTRARHLPGPAHGAGRALPATPSTSTCVSAIASTRSSPRRGRHPSEPGRPGPPGGGEPARRAAHAAGPPRASGERREAVAQRAARTD